MPAAWSQTAADSVQAPRVSVLQGDCLAVLPTLPAASFDAVVTDPPYLLNFRGDAWDAAPWATSAVSAFGHRDGSPRAPGALLHNTRNPVCRRCHRHQRGADRCVCEGPDFDTAEHRLSDMLRFATWCEAWASECLRVLKPGGHLLCFGAPRTHHWMAVGIEAAGFEIRDCIAWLKFGGFPKSTDLGKRFDRRAGAERPVTRVRRLQNIKGGAYLGRPGHATRNAEYADTVPVTELARRWDGWRSGLKPVWEPIIVARKPPDGSLIDNAARYGTGALNIDGCRVPWATAAATAHFGGRNVAAVPGGQVYAGHYDPAYLTDKDPRGRFPGNAVTLEPDAFWSPYTLVSPPECSRKIGYGDREPYNDHPTCKPVALMRWLCRLVTPPGGTVLDPFGGSGSTGVAAFAEGFGATLIEMEPHYCDIARRRLVDAAAGVPLGKGDGGASDNGRPRQRSLFEGTGE